LLVLKSSNDICDFGNIIVHVCQHVQNIVMVCMRFAGGNRSATQIIHPGLAGAPVIGFVVRTFCPRCHQSSASLSRSGHSFALRRHSRHPLAPVPIFTLNDRMILDHPRMAVRVGFVAKRGLSGSPSILVIGPSWFIRMKFIHIPIHPIFTPSPSWP
jgi:hypothetical protein